MWRVRVFCSHETRALPKLLGESGSWKIFESSINSNRSCNCRIWSHNKLTVTGFLIMLHRIFTQLLSSYSIFFITAASSQFFNFLATSCVAFLVKTALQLQFTTQNVFPHAEFDLPIDWLPLIVVVEIQALAATRSKKKYSEFPSPKVLNLQVVLSQI